MQEDGRENMKYGVMTAEKRRRGMRRMWTDGRRGVGGVNGGK